MYSTSSFHHQQPTYTVQYTPNYIIDSNRKFIHHNYYNNFNNKPDGYSTTTQHLHQQFPSTIHATIRYLPNHKQRTNILSTNWEPSSISPYLNSTYPTQLVNSQPVTLQHEITYSEQITIGAPTPCLNHHSCFSNQHHCLTQNQSCKCYSTNDNKNYYLIQQQQQPNSSLLESSSKLHNKSTDCMTVLNNNKKTKHSSIRGSKSQFNLNENSGNQLVVNKKKSTKFAATVNERFLRIFKKSVKEPFNTVKQRKSILDCDLTAYDLLESSKENEELISCNNKNNNVNKNCKNNNKIINSECIIKEEEEEEENDGQQQLKNQFDNNFKQAKAKQKQHTYLPFKDQQNNKDNQQHKNKDEEDDRWINYSTPTSTFASSNSRQKSLKHHYQNTQTKYNSCSRIAGQGMQLFNNKRVSILDSDLSKDNLKEELSEEEDLNRFSKYAENFDQLDKTEKVNCKLNDDKINKLDNNFRLFSKSSISNLNNNNSIPNLPDPDYDDENEDDEDHNTLTMFSRSTPDLDQAIDSLENEKRKRLSTFTNTTSLYNINNLGNNNNYSSPISPPPLPPLPKRTLPTSATVNNNVQKKVNAQSSSPTSSTYSSFNSSINSNVKSILKKSNPNLILLEHLKTVDLLDKKRKKEKYNNDNPLEEKTKSTRFSSTSKLLSTFKSNKIINCQSKNEEFNKPKKQVHFRSSFNDELIIEHINNNQELLNEEDEQIYDDILTTRLKQTNENIKEIRNSDEESEEIEKKNKQEEIIGNKDDNGFESKNFLKFDKNLNNLDTFDRKDYSNQSTENSIKFKADKEKKEESSKILSSCTGNIYSI